MTSCTVFEVGEGVSIASLRFFEFSLGLEVFFGEETVVWGGLLSSLIFGHNPLST